MKNWKPGGIQPRRVEPAFLEASSTFRSLRECPEVGSTRYLMGTDRLTCRLAGSFPQRFVGFVRKTDKHLNDFRNRSVFGPLIAFEGAGTREFFC